MDPTRPQPAHGVDRRWRTVALGFTVGVLAYAALSFRPPPSGDPAPSVVTVREVTPSSQPLADPRLGRVLKRVDSDAVGLGAVLSDLSRRGGINVLPDWPKLAEVGMTQAVPVTLHLTAVRWATALDAAVLMAAPDRKAGWTQRGELVLVTRADATSLGPAVTRLYDVRPLVQRIGRPESTSVGQAQSTCWPTPGHSAGQSVDEDALDRLKQQVENIVDPTSWIDNGGDLGTIWTFGGDLIVTQSEQNQQRVAATLALLAGRP